MIADISFLEKKNERSRAGAYNSGMIADISFLERNRKKKNPFFVFVALFIIAAGVFGSYFSLYAATSTRRAPLVFQGRITDASYVPLADTTTRRMIFRIHTHATNSACVWSTGNLADTNEAGNCAIVAGDDTSVATTITRGVFSIPLGDTTYHANMRAVRLDFNNTSNEVYYLEIIVKNDSGTYETLSPRIRVGSSAYAYNADELDGLNSASFLRADTNTTLTQTAATSGSPTALTITGGAHTGLTASTEATDVNFNLARTVTFATGNITAQRAMLLSAPTYAFAGASTITNAATLAISGGPAAGAAATISRPIGLWIQGDNMVNGNFLRISYPNATTLQSLLYGILINLDTNVTANGSATGQIREGVNIVLPASTNSTAGASSITGINITAGAINNSSAGTMTWIGADIGIPTLSETSGTTTATAIRINGPIVGAGATSYAFVSGESAGNVGIGDTTPDLNFEILSSSGSTAGLLITKTDGNDPVIQLALADGTNANFTLGVDNSAAGDPFKISTTSLGTNDFLVIDPRTSTTGVTGVSINAPIHTTAFTADAANIEYTTFSITPPNISFSGITQITFQMDSILFNVPTLSIPNGLTVDGAATFTISGAPIFDATAPRGTLTNSYALKINGATTSGNGASPTNAYGLYVNAPTGATNNIAGYFEGNVGINAAVPDTALDLSGTISYTPSATQTITAVGNTVLANAAMVVLDPNGDYTLTSTPTIANGATGQVVIITAGNGEANTVTLQDEGSLGGSNLQLGAATRAISGKDILVLMFDGTDWIEISYANN